MSIPPDRLNVGRTLLAAGPITQQRLQAELQRSGKAGSVLGKALLQSGFPTDEEMIAPLLRLRIPKINVRSTKIPLETIRLVPPDVARRCKVLPIDQLGEILVVVTPNLSDAEGMAEVRKATGFLLTPIQCAPEGFDQVVDEYYQRLAESGLAPAASPTAAAAAGAPAGAGVAANGVVRAIPVGDENEDAFWKRYASAGPFPAEQVLM